MFRGSGDDEAPVSVSSSSHRASGAGSKISVGLCSRLESSYDRLDYPSMREREEWGAREKTER